MNDPTAPPAFEWFMRISAVLGMVVLYVLMVKIAAQISGGQTLPPQMESRSQITER